jgi:hypothetical protein
MVYDPAQFITAKFPKLTAALARIADNGADRRPAVDAYASEMLPTILGDQWAYGGTGMPWADAIPLELSAHLLWFRRNDDLPSWENCAVIGNPRRSFVDDGRLIDGYYAAGKFIPSFLAAAQPLLEQGVGVWVSTELSYWHPGRTVCVLLAAGLAPETLLRLGSAQ